MGRGGFDSPGATPVTVHNAVTVGDSPDALTHASLTALRSLRSTCARYSAYVAAGALVVAACSATPPSSSGPVSSLARATSGSVAESIPRNGVRRALTARGLVNELARAGFSVPNLLDTSRQDCPSVGCDQSIVTDTLRVKSFATTTQAERYAAPRGFYHVATIVVSFAPPISESEQARYRAEIQRIVG